ncbi:type II secretion system F family protein [Candidatus Micrarchaeota archaeon]|nr:type II secretion system F family protein [Candidatus Micrarchaeota archaeon]
MRSWWRRVVCVADFLSWWTAQRDAEALDGQLPAALFSLASLDSHVSVEDAFLEVAVASPSPLREAFQGVVRQLKSGVGFSQAMDALRRRYPSALLARVTGLWASAYQSGADMSEAYRSVAEEAFLFQRLQAERRQSFAVQKYTLWAGLVLVPGLLGLLFSWVADPTSPYVHAVFFGLQVYLVLFSVLSALLVGVVDGSMRLVLRDAMVFAGVSFLVFHGVQALG